MTLDEAIQHCEEVAMNLKEKGFEANVKANNATDFGENCYKCAEEHQQLAEWLKELKAYREQRGERMNEAEKERLIKKDIESVENRVRHAFNQGYEMGRKESRSENPNTCGDAVSRQAVLEGLASIAKAKAKSDAQKSLMGRVMFFTEQLPPVTPQQKMGNWIESKGYDDIDHFYVCSECGRYINLNRGSKLSDYPYCHCGAKMEEVKG